MMQNLNLEEEIKDDHRINQCSSSKQSNNELSQSSPIQAMITYNIENTTLPNNQTTKKDLDIQEEEYSLVFENASQRSEEQQILDRKKKYHDNDDLGENLERSRKYKDRQQESYDSENQKNGKKKKSKKKKHQIKIKTEQEIDTASETSNKSQGARNHQKIQKNIKFDKKRKILVISFLIFIVAGLIIIFSLYPLIDKNNQNPELGQQNQVNTTDRNESIKYNQSMFFLDPISQRPSINFPISKQQFLAALQDDQVQYIPLKFELNEVCNYTAIVNFMVESDSLVNASFNGKQQQVAYNASFYTIGYNVDYFTIAIRYVQDIQEQNNSENNQDQSNVNSQNSQNDTESAQQLQSISDLFDNITGQSQNQTNTDPEPPQDDEEISPQNISKILAQTKFSICNISWSGAIIQCQFNVNMSFSDNTFSLKLLNMYIPNMNKDHYTQKRRMLTLRELDEQTSQDSTGAIQVDGSSSQIGLQSQNKDSMNDGNMDSSGQSHSEHSLDLDTGKVSNVQKNDKVGYSSPNNSSQNKSSVNNINSQANMTMNFISRKVLQQENIDDELWELEVLQFITIADPVTFFNNRNFSMQNVSEFDEGQNLTQLNRLLLGRDLGSSSFTSIDFILGQLQLLFINLQGGFSFYCYDDNNCITGLFLEPSPFPRFWPIKREVQGNMGKIIKQYRYVKLAFQNNIQLLKNITDQIDTLLNVLIFDNLDTIESEFIRLTQPAIDFELSFQNYTNTVLNKATSLSECLDITNSISEVLDSYATMNLKSFISQMQLQIDQVSVSFQLKLESFYDNIIDLQFKNSSVALIETQLNNIVAIFDSILDEFETQWDQFFTTTLLKIDPIKESLIQVGQGSQLQSMGYSNIVQSILDIAQSSLDQLTSPLKQSYTVLKDKLSINIHLYHAKQRQSIVSQVKQILKVLKVQIGQETINSSQMSSISLSQFAQITSSIDFDVDFQDITSGASSTSLLDEIQARISRDVTRAFEIVKEILTCADERQFFDESFQILKTGYSQINSTILTNIGNIIPQTITRFSTKFDLLKTDIMSIPGNIEASFSNTQAMNEPSGVIDINQEVKEIKALLQQVEDIMDNFSDSINIMKRIDSEISLIKIRLQEVLDAPNRIKKDFEDTLAKLKNIGNQLKLSFKLPSFDFNLGLDAFDSLFQTMISQIRTRALQFGIDRVKLIGKQYGSNFLDSLNRKLSSKISQILPSYNPPPLFNKQYNKEMTLFQQNIPIAYGSLYVQVAQSFSASIIILCNFQNGKLSIVIDPKAKFAYYLRMAWDLFLVRTGLSLGGIVFEGRILTEAGFNIFSLTPSAFITSSIYFQALAVEFALVYQYYYPRLFWRCWTFRIFRRRRRFCFPFIRFVWSPWKYITYYKKAIGFYYEKVLLNKQFALSLL